MVGLPKPITAATGIDALTHGIEAYISTWERGNRTEMGRISVQGVFRWLRLACDEPGNMDAREGMALAAYNAGVAINQVNVGNVHAIAHQLGANFGVPHGHANALVLPHVLTLYGETAVERLAELAVATGISDSGHPETRARAFIAEVEQLIADVGIAPTDARIKRDAFDAIAEAAMDEGDGYFCPRQLEKSEILNVLEAISE
jgi:alcohol dehydrogenase class IV